MADCPELIQATEVIPKNMIIRDAVIEDAEELLKIYDHYVRNTAISFEVTTPSVYEFQERMRSFMQHYPYIVIEDNGRIEGYAYAHLFVGREAYDHSCETTIYLRHDSVKKGYGRKLYEALEDKLRDMGIINLYACIGEPVGEDDEYLTRNSSEFHEHMGYRLVGEFRKCGRKFGRWYNMVWMEKLLGEHSNDPGEIKWRDMTL